MQIGEFTHFDLAISVGCGVWRRVEARESVYILRRLEA